MGVTTVGTIELVAKIDTGAYKKGANEIDASNKKIEGSTDKADSGLTKLAKNGLKTAVVGFVGLATAIGAMTIGGGISRALNIEDAQAKLRGLGHDAKSVEDIMTSALDSVKGTAYGLDAAATLAATAVAAGVEPGQDLTKYLSLAADAATIAGTSLDEMGSIFGKVQTQQRAYTQELNMLADRGIPIYQWLQEELGKTQEELRDMVAKGELDSETYFKAIQKNIGGAALESGKTTRGAYQNLLAAMSRIGARIVQGPIDGIRNGFGSLTQWIDKNADTIVDTVKTAMSITVNVLTTLVNVTKTLLPIIIGVTAAWVGYRVAVIATNAVMAAQNALMYVTGTRYVMLNGALVTMRTTTTAATVAQAALNVVMKANPIGLVVGLVAGLVSILAVLLTTTNNNTSATDKLNAARRVQAENADKAREAEDRLRDANLGVERATLGVEASTKAYNDAVTQYGAKSLEARQAALGLKDANIELENATRNQRKEQEKNLISLDGLNERLDKLNGKSVTYTVNGRQQFVSEQDGQKFYGGSFSTGGFTGRGGVNDVAGVVHRGEYVLPQSMVDQNTGMPDFDKMGGTTVEYNIANINISSEVDGERWLRRLTNDSEIVSHGLVPQQRYMGA